MTNQSGESTGSTTSADQSEEGPEVTTSSADQSEKPEAITITLDKPVGKVTNPIDLLYQSCKSNGYNEDVCRALCGSDVAVDYSP